MSPLPLQGRRVLVTRAVHQAGKLSDGLRALGAIPVEVPVLEIRPPESFDPLDAALRRLGEYDWIILTSANTVRALAHRAAELRIDLHGLSRLKVAAVGEATAAAARNLGFQITLVPETYVAESLVQSLAARVNGEKVLLARAAMARDVIPEALRAAGAAVDIVDAYRNGMPESAPAQLQAALSEPIDAATFTSSSTASHLAQAARAAGIAWPIAAVPAVSIGPVTSATLSEMDWTPAAEANPSDISGLIAALVQVLQRP